MGTVVNFNSISNACVGSNPTRAEKTTRWYYLIVNQMMSGHVRGVVHRHISRDNIQSKHKNKLFSWCVCRWVYCGPRDWTICRLSTCLSYLKSMALTTLPQWPLTSSWIETSIKGVITYTICLGVQYLCDSRRYEHCVFHSSYILGRWIRKPRLFSVFSLHALQAK